MLCGIDPRKHVSLSSIVGKDIDILLYRISYGSILCRSSNVNFQPLDCILIASCMNCFSCSFSFEKEDEIKVFFKLQSNNILPKMTFSKYSSKYSVNTMFRGYGYIYIFFYRD